MVIDMDMVIEEKDKRRWQQCKYRTHKTNILPKRAHKRLIFSRNWPKPLFLSMMNIREFCVYFTPVTSYLKTNALFYLVILVLQDLHSPAHPGGQGGPPEDQPEGGEGGGEPRPQFSGQEAGRLQVGLALDLSLDARDPPAVPTSRTSAETPP